MVMRLLDLDLEGVSNEMSVWGDAGGGESDGRARVSKASLTNGCTMVELDDLLARRCSTYCGRAIVCGRWGNEGKGRKGRGEGGKGRRGEVLRGEVECDYHEGARIRDGDKKALKRSKREERGEGR
jgi:hypothetical protein